LRGVFFCRYNDYIEANGGLMKFDAFSVSLAVKDLSESRRFYEGLGFSAIDGAEPGAGGMPAHMGWALLEKEGTKIGLFMGMFKDNLLTFHLPDARSLEQELKASGATFVSETKPGEGPTSFMVKDPDGNPLLFDQH